MRITPTVRTERFDEQLRTFIARATNEREPIIRVGLARVEIAYTNAMRRRGIRNSKGGGDWAPLRPSTLAGKKPNRGILRRTDTLLNSLSPGRPFHLTQLIPHGIRIGSTDRKIGFHQFGTSRMAKREVMVRPDPKTQTEIDGEIQTAVNKLATAIFGPGSING